MQALNALHRTEGADHDRQAATRAATADAHSRPAPGGGAAALDIRSVENSPGNQPVTRQSDPADAPVETTRAPPPGWSAASTAVLAVIACKCARSRSPRVLQSKATRVSCAACSNCHVASPMSTAPRASGDSLAV